GVLTLKISGLAPLRDTKVEFLTIRSYRSAYFFSRSPGPACRYPRTRCRGPASASSALCSGPADHPVRSIKKAGSYRRLLPASQPLTTTSSAHKISNRQPEAHSFARIVRVASRLLIHQAEVIMSLKVQPYRQLVAQHNGTADIQGLHMVLICIVSKFHARLLLSGYRSDRGFGI